MKRKLKCAVIGVGNMGKKHIKIFSSLKDVELVAVCDTDEESGKKVAKTYRTTFYNSHVELFRKHKIDVVSICVPTKHHHKVGKQCILAGVHVLMEKPITDSVENGKELLGLANEKNVTFLVGHVERFNPAIVATKEIIDSGEIGEVVEISAKRFGMPPAQTKNNNVAIDLAIHDLDIINFLLAETPMEVKKTSKEKLIKGEVEFVEFVLKYKNASANVSAKWSNNERIRKLDVVGDKGMLKVDYINQEVLFKSNILPSKTKSLIIENTEPLREQILYFIELARGKNIINSRYALEALKIAVIS